jgi:hypothetical protein
MKHNLIDRFAIIILLIGVGILSLGVRQAIYMGNKNTEMILENTKHITKILENEKFILEKIK